MPKVVTVAIFPSFDGLSSKLREMLSELRGVCFVAASAVHEILQCDAVLTIQPLGAAEISRLSCITIPWFRVVSTFGNSIQSKDTAEVRFTASGFLPPILRGRTVSHNPLGEFTALKLNDGDELLATYEGEPIWAARRTSSALVFSVSLGMPDPLGEPFDFLNGYHFILLLPLLEFLTHLQGNSRWLQPPLRACLMFDDPNLHLPWYGYLPYAELVKRAKRDNFHVAFATVPLDCWSSHEVAVRTFRDNPAQLSLLVHGNDHTKEELGRSPSPEATRSLLAQGLKRIAQLEGKTGLEVDRVMVPPHEALCEKVIAHLFDFGFEAACLTHWSLRYWNPQTRWPASFGLTPSELVFNSFPILGRYDLSKRTEGPVLISALLGQPIVLFEHHEAAAQGLDILSKAADNINSAGPVVWCGAKAMSRSNYLHFVENQTLHLKPYSCKISARIPENITAISIHASGPRFGEVFQVEVEGLPTRRVSELSPISVKGPGIVSIQDVSWSAVSLETVPRRKLSFRALSRRILCEARDRFPVVVRSGRTSREKSV